jgi:squalene-hopene/tetraprenyl-beta-curcumene cyclase
MEFDSAAKFARAEDAEIPRAKLDAAISLAQRSLLALQRDDGHFVFELEADATIPAEYVLMRHYLAEPVDAVLEGKIANYLRRIQSKDGSTTASQTSARRSRHTML